MLILTRRVGQGIDLKDRRQEDADLCTVYVLDVTNGVVRLGFNAPEHVRIVRDDARRRDDGNEEIERGEISGNR